MMDLRRSVLDAVHPVGVTPANALTFTANMAAPLQRCKVGFSGSQTGIVVTVCGKNIAPDTRYVDGYFINGSGVVTSNNNYRYMPDFIPVVPGATYTVQMHKTVRDGVAFTVPFYTKTKEFISRTSAISASTTSGIGTYTGSFTAPSNAVYIRYSVPYSSEDISIIRGTTGTDYEAYDADKYTFTWPDALTGGYVDCVNGDVVDGNGVHHAITPQKIMARAGINNVYADTGENIELAYWTRWKEILP